MYTRYFCLLVPILSISIFGFPIKTYLITSQADLYLDQKSSHILGADKIAIGGLVANRKQKGKIEKCGEE